jgi:hypothetical protein
MQGVLLVVMIGASSAQASRVNPPRVHVELLGESLERDFASAGPSPFGQAAAGRGLFAKTVGGFLPRDRRVHVAISRL